MEKRCMEIIREIDPSLKYMEEFKMGSVKVLKVEKEGTIHVLKTAQFDYEWGVDHLKQERKILDLANGIRGITHLVQNYRDTENYKNPMLKEFYEGQSLRELNVKIQDTNAQKKLENTVRDLHSLGVAILDIQGRNIVLSPDKQDACLIDMGCGKLLQDTHSSEFERLKEDDLHDLEAYIFE